MSYTRSFSREVAVHYSGSVSYPASQHGGTVNYSGTAYETVNVNIHIDTNPFDQSVASCNNSVNGLTASVGAMNAAQCLAISVNADKVSKSLIDGFFHTVRTDLSTQRAELEQTVDARLMLLRQQAQMLQQKRKEMEDHYARTSARYQKMFEELNNELAARIHAIDENVFRLVKNVGEQSDRMLHTDLVQTAVTLNKENSIAQSRLNVATVKKHALQAIRQAETFLTTKARSEQTMKDSVIEGSGNDSYMMPVCFMETANEHRQMNQQCVLPDEYKSIHDQVAGIVETVFANNSEQMDWLEKQQLQAYLQEEIATNISGDDSHSSRVRVLIKKMFNDLANTL